MLFDSEQAEESKKLFVQREKRRGIVRASQAHSWRAK